MSTQDVIYISAQLDDPYGEWIEPFVMTVNYVDECEYVTFDAFSLSPMTVPYNYYQT